MADEYPNLAKSPIFITVCKLTTKKDLAKLSEKKQKKVIKKTLKKKGMKIHENYDWEKKETINVVTQEKHDEKYDTDPVFEDDVKIPKKYRGENPRQKGEVVA